MSNPTWAHERPYRNLNPLDLRPRSAAPPWPGQVALDTLSGGPFAIFATIADGWAAGGLWLLLAHDEWGLNTVKKMVTTFAPWVENDTAAYTGTVCARLGITEDTVIDPHDVSVRRALSQAMAHVEDYKVVWDAGPLESGLLLTDAKWPAFLAAYRAGGGHPASSPIAPRAVESSADTSADALNGAELNSIKPMES